MLSGYDTESRGLSWLRHCLASERAEFGVAFNPLRDSFRRDPEGGYAELRDRSPVHYSKLLDCWVVTRHREVDRLLRASDTFRSDPRSTTQQLVDPYVMLDPDHPSLFMLDPPDHTRLRGTVRDAFSPAAVHRLTPLLEEHVRDVVASLGRPGDRVDLVPRFAAVVPLRVLDLVTGLDSRPEDRIAGWAAAIVRGLEPIATERTAQRALTAYHALGAHLDEQRARPAREGTLRWSLDRAVRSGRMADAEARQLLLFLMLAGTTTVSDFLASAVLHQAALPAHAPERSQVGPGLIDDLLARASPVQIVARTAARPTVLTGHRIRAGQRVLLVLASANQDASSTPCPDGAHAGRTRRYLTFGRGIHRCPGAQLARVQGRLALSLLFDRYPGIRPAEAVLSRRCVTLRSWNSVTVHL